MALGLTAHAEAETQALTCLAQHLCFSHQATLLPVFFLTRNTLVMVTVSGSL